MTTLSEKIARAERQINRMKEALPHMCKCGNEIPKWRWKAGCLTCRPKCQGVKNSNMGSGLNTSKNTTGVIAELMVATDLLKKGFSVFRSVSPTCQCDLIVLIGEKALRVEVRSGWRQKNGQIFYPTPDNRHVFDIAAVYLHRESLVFYSPDPFTEGPLSSSSIDTPSSAMPLPE